MAVPLVSVSDPVKARLDALQRQRRLELDRQVTLSEIIEMLLAAYARSIREQEHPCEETNHE